MAHDWRRLAGLPAAMGSTPVMGRSVAQAKHAKGPADVDNQDTAIAATSHVAPREEWIHD